MKSSTDTRCYLASNDRIAPWSHSWLVRDSRWPLEGGSPSTLQAAAAVHTALRWDAAMACYLHRRGRLRHSLGALVLPGHRRGHRPDPL